MNEATPASLAPLVTGGAFLLAFIFGAVANKTDFCTMGAVSDWVNMGHTGRLRMWLLAIAVGKLLLFDAFDSDSWTNVGIVLAVALIAVVGLAKMLAPSIRTRLFTPLFTVARVAGWSAHRMEELMTGGKIIRPAYKSVCAQRKYVRLDERLDSYPGELKYIPSDERA